MLTIVSLKNLAVTLCGVTYEEIKGDTVAEVLQYIADNHKPVPPIPSAAGTYNVVVDDKGIANWTLVS